MGDWTSCWTCPECGLNFPDNPQGRSHRPERCRQLQDQAISALLPGMLERMADALVASGLPRDLAEEAVGLRPIGG